MDLLLYKLLKLLLEYNSAAWNGDDWVEYEDDHFGNLWVSYQLSFTGGPRFEVWNKEELVDLVWSVEDLVVAINKELAKK